MYQGFYGIIQIQNNLCSGIWEGQQIRHFLFIQAHDHFKDSYKRNGNIIMFITVKLLHQWYEMGSEGFF